MDQGGAGAQAQHRREQNQTKIVLACYAIDDPKHPAKLRMQGKKIIK
jgi:hypothetical protein